MLLRDDCDCIVEQSIRQVLPDEAVRRALTGKAFPSGKLILISVGKAAWSMANAAWESLGPRIDSGIVVTKHGYSSGSIGPLIIREAGHPVPDEASFAATEEILKLTAALSEQDTVLFLLSGGGSALFESPLVTKDELQQISNDLLACGADIVEINTIRKRLSAVKGGRFALHCAPAKIFSIVLSDILGNPLDMIASGPAYPDSGTGEDAARIVRKYSLRLSADAQRALSVETPKQLTNVETCVTGSVKELCRAAADVCRQRGYQAVILTDCLNCEAREAGRFLASIAKSNQNVSQSTAYICGGETVVHLRGAGKGGRNQELALSAASEIDGLKDTAVFSFGSDGTDGPTDAAGGYSDGSTAAALREMGISVFEALRENDSYPALQAVNGLIITGPTGTNVNDVSIVLIRR